MYKTCDESITKEVNKKEKILFFEFLLDSFYKEIYIVLKQSSYNKFL